MRVLDSEWNRSALTQNGADAATTGSVHARCFERLPDGRIRCVLCPHLCRLEEGEAGFCGVRVHRHGGLSLPFFGAASALAVDPIEKKPLYHYHPGSNVYSIGFLGCPLRCPFCQNYRISQSTSAATRTLTPAQLVHAATTSACIGIAYTYNEPIIHFEFVMETAVLARAAGLKNVLVTSGQINEEPAKELFDAMDAANIDLKSFDAGFYRRELAGSLAAVKRSIELATQRCHVEVTTLVIPGKTDSDAEIESIARFLASLNADIPYHLSAYYPAYRYVTRATEPQTIHHVTKVARRHLKYVYSGNIPGDNTTYCCGCGAVLVSRSRQGACVVGLRNGACTRCGAPSPILNS